MKYRYTKPSTETLAVKEIIRYIAYFLLIFLFLGIVFHLISLHAPSVDIPYFWPLSMFTPKALCLLGFKYPDYCQFDCSVLQFDPSTVIVTSLVYGLLFILILKKIDKFNSPYKIYIIGTIIIFLSNFLQGIQGGLVYPVVAARVQYYNDAIKIDNALDFINNYNAIQPDLLVHSRTHPPGAVLIYYLLNSIFPNTIFISLALMAISLLSIFYIYKLSEIYFNKEIASFLSLVFIFLPAVQIYYLSCLDSLVSLAFLGLIYYYLMLKNNQKTFEWVRFGFFFFLSFSLNYLAIFPLSLIILDLIRNKNMKMIIAIAGILFIFITSNMFLGYNYVTGFRLASSLENPQGFRLFSDTASYVATRFENVAEILLFFGPVPIVMAYQGLKRKENELVKLSISAIALLIFFFIAGVDRTGETARCCLFIYPFLLFLVANSLYYTNIDLNDKSRFLIVLWIQSIVMQIVGFYVW